MNNITKTVIALYITLSICFPKIASASDVLFSDDFSSGFNKWTPVRDDGSRWTIVNNAAQAYVNRSSSITEMVPRDDFWNPAWKNIRYELDFTPIEGFDKNISFSFKDIKNWYEIHFIGNSYNLAKLSNGSVVLSLFEPYQMINGKTYRVKIETKEKNIKVYVDEKLIGNFDDHTFNNDFGRIGMKAGTGAIFPTRVSFDNILVTSLDEPEMTHFKQNDPLWAANEYDSATKWDDNPTMERWGCATTSMANILKHYGINKLPDGTDLNPDTYNQWLMGQPDGYLGEGLHNWLAATRLTRLMSTTLNTPKLEYQRVVGDDLQPAISEVENNKPVILQIPGHFLVSDKYESGELQIKDPLFDYTVFSQHSQPLVTTSIFTPSQTDLSYILLAVDESLDVTIKNQAGVILKTDQFVEYMKDRATNKSSKPYKIVQISKPTEGKYFLEFKTKKMGEYYLNILAYDTQANPSVLSEKKVVSSEPLRLELNYFKNNSSQLGYKTSFSALLTTLDHLYQTKQITSRYNYLKIRNLLVAGSRSSDSRYLLRVKNSVISLTTVYKSSFTPQGYAYFIQQLSALTF